MRVTQSEVVPPEVQPASSASPDEVLTRLDELMTVARENIIAWVAVMERVEQIREHRRAGLSYRDMQLNTSGPSVIDAVSSNQERLTLAAAHFRRALARALVREGLSYAEVARLFGVTRQRVGNLLRGDDKRSEEL